MSGKGKKTPRATGDAPYTGKAAAQGRSRVRRQSADAPGSAGKRKVIPAKEWVFGIHAVDSVLRHRPERVESLWLAADGRNPRLQELVRLAAELGVTCEFKPAASLDKKCADRHQGVLAAVKPHRFPDEGDLAVDAQNWHNPLVLVLDSVEDPRNLGACLRSADAAGAQAVILPRHKSARITAVARKTAAGAADALPVYLVTNLVRALEILKQAGLWVAGSDCGKESKTIYQAPLDGPLALVMGNEGKGLRPLVRSHCDFLVHIPMRGTVQSLNVAVATGVCLFEALRQRECVGAPASRQTPGPR